MKVINIGSLNIDKVYTVDHFVSRGETLASEKLEFYTGGKGLNQSVALSLAGVSVLHAGMIGEDGLFLKQYLASQGVDTNLIRVTDGVSGHAVIQVDREGQNCILLYGGANKMFTKEFIDEVLDEGEEGDILLLQNEVNGLGYIMEEAHKRGMRIAFNPSPADEGLKALPLELVSWFILNETEGHILTGESIPEDVLEKMAKFYPASEIVLTLGKEGAVVCSSGTLYRHGIYSVNTVDTTAAGDTFTGYYLASAMSGKKIEECIETASKAAALAVSRKGAAPSIPKPEDIRCFFG